MIVAAHQPAFLPWLGYLDKVARADVFVVMDDLQYEVGNFQNRNRVRLATGAHWLTVPLLRGKQLDRICDKRIDNTGRGGRHHWQHRAWRTLELNYHRAPHWGALSTALAPVFAQKWERLIDLDLCVFDLACRWFRIDTPIVRSSTLGLRGARTERIANMCDALGTRTYLSGRGGSTSYLDTVLLADRGINVSWQSFTHPRHRQQYPGFVSHLAFVDFAANVGRKLEKVITA